MTSYRIPCGKYIGRAIDNLSDNILSGLLWAYRPDGLNNEELHGECFAVLYSRHGSAEAVAKLVDSFEDWVSKNPKERKADKAKAKPKAKAKAKSKARTKSSYAKTIPNNLEFPSDVVIDPDEICPF